MKLTATKVSEDTESLRTTFESDQIQVRFSGQVFNGYKDNPGQQMKATLWGMQFGFEMVVSFDIGNKNVKVKSGEEIELKINSRWKKFRIGQVDSNTGTVYKVIIVDLY